MYIYIFASLIEIFFNKIYEKVELENINIVIKTLEKRVLFHNNNVTNITMRYGSDLHRIIIIQKTFVLLYYFMLKKIFDISFEAWKYICFS